MSNTSNQKHTLTRKEHDPDSFYPNLVSQKAVCSSWGKMLLTAGNTLRKNKDISRDEFKRFFSFQDGWEHRFGFYLDDGKIYVYRIGFLLCRFQMTIGKPIHNFQTAADFDVKMAQAAFKNAMESVECYWYRLAEFKE